jgi:serine/threonine-protein kinase
MGAQAAPRGKAGLIVAAAAGLLLIGGGAFVVMRGGGASKEGPKAAEPTPAVAPKPAEPPKQEMVTITITSEPSGAKVVRADTGGVGATPWDIALPKGSPSFDIQVKLDGYVPQTRTIKTDTTKEIVVPLVKVAAPPPPPVVPVANVAPRKEAKPEKVDKPEKVERPKSSSSRRKKEENPDDMKLLTPKF